MSVFLCLFDVCILFFVCCLLPYYLFSFALLYTNHATNPTESVYQCVKPSESNGHDNATLKSCSTIGPKCKVSTLFQEGFLICHHKEWCLLKTSIFDDLITISSLLGIYLQHFVGGALCLPAVLGYTDSWAANLACLGVLSEMGW